MPDAAADSGLSAFDTSIHAQTLSAFVSCAKNDRARAVLPEHSAPIISVTAPTGSPPSRTASIATIPVGTTSRIVFAAGVSADGIRSARAASIWERRAAADLIVFALYSPTAPKCTNAKCNENCAIASKWLNRLHLSLLQLAALIDSTVTTDPLVLPLTMALRLRICQTQLCRP